MAVQYIFVLNAILFGSLISGLSVDSPASGSQLDTSRKTTVTWSSNDSDPHKFNLYLVNDARFPSISLQIARNIDSSAGSYGFDGVDAIPGSGYRLDLKDTDSSDILAQSDQFIIVAKGSDTTVASAGTSTTATTTTTTTTATTTEDSGDTDSTTISSTSSDDETITETEVTTTDTTSPTAVIPSSSSSSEYVSLSSTPSSSGTGSAETTTPNSALSLTCKSPSPSFMGAVIALFAWMW